MERPGHSRDAEGNLFVGSAGVHELAQQYGTPLLVVDIGLLRATIGRMRAACEPRNVGISYAAKAFLLPQLAAIVAESGVGIDVCSLGELEIAEAGGFPAARITMHGAGKTDDELRACIAGRAGRIVVDGLCELERLAQLAAVPVDVVVRLNTGVDVDTHPHVTTVGETSKFGIAPEEEEAAAVLLRSNPHLHFIGLHAHVGSQVSDAATLRANVESLETAARRFSQRGFESETLVAGGGFAVRDDAADAFDLVHAVGTVAAGRRVEIEPGRAIVAHAGTTIYRVMATKRRGGCPIVIVDGGIADNPRPALYGAVHAIIPGAQRGAPLQRTLVYGRACETDFIGEMPLPADLRRGDVVAACTTGAYTYSMSSTYNGFPKPAVVTVEDGRHQRWC